jgi:Protein of unknown function (DUF3105)
MGPQGSSGPSRPAPRSGLSSYVAAWLVGGVAVAAAAIVFLGGARHAGGRAALPPLHEIALSSAARKAGCVVRRRRRGAEGLTAPTGGIYQAPVPHAGIERAVRSGMIVIQYREGVDGDVVDGLEGLQEAVPEGTVLAPMASAGRDQLTVLAYARQLRCPDAAPRSLEALRLFQGRYLGTAPRD